MSDFDQVKAALPLVRYMERGGAKQNGGHWDPAPCCGHKKCFSVDADRGLWHCHSCGEGGDLIDLHMRVEGVDKGEALRELAEMAGVRLPRRGGEGRPAAPQMTRKQEAWATAAVEVFHAALMADAAMLAHQVDVRGHREETLKRFRVGWAAGGIAPALKERGFKQAELVKAGLLTKGEDGKAREFFRGCFVYPSFDAAGRPLHMRCKFPPGADGAKRPGYQLPTAVRDKGWIVYNQGALGRHDTVIVCEGEDDLLTWVESGFPNVVATCGGPSKEQLEFLTRHHGGKTWLLAYDADQAGREFVERFAKRGLKIKILPPPGEADKEGR